MKIKPGRAMALAFLAVIVSGSMGIRPLHSQGSIAPAYVIAEADVADADNFKIFSIQIPPTLARYRGRILVQGGKTKSLDGVLPKSIDIIAFPSAAEAQSWYASPEFEKIRPLRDKSAKVRVYIVEGMAP